MTTAGTFGPRPACRVRTMTDLSAFPALVLNADARPLSSHPLSTWGWKDAMTAVFFGRVDVLARYERSVRTAGGREIALPSVVLLKKYVAPVRRVSVTRFGIFTRDGHRCSYCLERKPTSELTFDHVVPRSRGGESSWENLASACMPCNFRKANRTPTEAGMPLLQPAYEPTQADLYAKGMEFGALDPIPTSWLDFVYWRVPLQN